ncbi:MAG: hypothetical protein ACRD17_01430 [Terriglobales bacterium]
MARESSRRDFLALAGGPGLAALLLPILAPARKTVAQPRIVAGDTATALVQPNAPVHVEDAGAFADTVAKELHLSYTLVNRGTFTAESVQLMVCAFNDRNLCVAGEQRTIPRLNLAPGGRMTLATRLSNLLYAPTHRRYVAGVLWVVAANGQWREQASPVEMQDAMRVHKPLANDSWQFHPNR